MQTIPFWRVCRVIANRPRLNMLGLISRRPGLRVSEIARLMKLSRPAASQYLRALESCGFVASRRRGRPVTYEIAGRQEVAPSLRKMTDALMSRLALKNGITTTFKLATAFASPGR